MTSRKQRARLMDKPNHIDNRVKYNLSKHLKAQIFRLVVIENRTIHYLQETDFRGFPGGTVVRNLPANAGDTGSIPGPRRSHSTHILLHLKP